LPLPLPDPLGPIGPSTARADRALDAFLHQHCPRTAQRYPIQRMRELRALMAERHPQFLHDYSHQRVLSLRHALEDSGDDLSHAEPAYEAFIVSRNQVDFYPDALAALGRLSARLPVAALTNGNADLERIGIQAHFQIYVSAREHGHAKPDTPIFHATCERLGQAPADVLHIGDDPMMDVVGARRAGMPSCWINRRRERWPADLPRPDLEFATLAGLADWLDHTHPLPEPR
ncbi:MAG: HAD family hydrolase, partial [Arenimonas sp.]|uniref:HAD family hydrolase n=1 Tax=Arenimonas sp. TaxID=1872635 RepID=UPI0025C4AC61